MCSSRLVEPPNAAWTTIALRMAASVRTSASLMPRSRSDQSASALRRAMSSQIGWPEGASAEWGSESPSASPTTCDVAAVPRNWQPPPGEAQARQPNSAASSRLSSPWANRAPIVCTLPASSPTAGGNVTPPGTSTQGKSREPASAIIIAGSPLSQVATPSTPCRVGSERIRRRKIDGGVVAIRQAVEHAGRALRAAVARIGAEGGKRHAARLFEFASGGFDQQADFPMSGVVAQRHRRAVGGANAPLRAEHQELGPEHLLRRPAHAGVLRHAEQVAAGPVSQHFGRERQRASRPGSIGLNLEQRRLAAVENLTERKTSGLRGGHTNQSAGRKERPRASLSRKRPAAKGIG